MTVSEIVAVPCRVPEVAVTVTVEVVDIAVGVGDVGAGVDDVPPVPPQPKRSPRPA